MGAQPEEHKCENEKRCLMFLQYGPTKDKFGEQILLAKFYKYKFLAAFQKHSSL